jgi:predicted ferric reductase
MRVPRAVPTATYVYITVPKISAEAHAFRVTCSGHDPTSITLMILEIGDWTRELQKAFLQERAPQEAIGDPGKAGETVCMREANVSMLTDPSGHAVALGNRHTKVFVDGPYFAPAMHIRRCETAIIITTGSGISPGSAPLSSAQYEAPRRDWRLRRLYFIYVAASETLYLTRCTKKIKEGMSQT